MNKPQKKFDFIVEEVTSRYQQGGLVTGDFVLIRKDALKNDKLKGRPSNFIEKLKEIIATKLPLRVSAVKSERPESSNDLIGGANHSGTNYWVDVCIEYAPGLWRDPMTLPLEVLDINNPSDYNLPSWPDEVKRDNKLEIKPTKIKTDKKELNIKQTQGDQRALDTKNVKIPVGKVKDGRDQTKVKESVEDLTEQEKLEDVYSSIITEQADNLTPEQEPTLNTLLDKGFRITRISHKYALEEGGPTVFLTKRHGSSHSMAEISPNGMVNGVDLQDFLNELEPERNEGGEDAWLDRAYEDRYADEREYEDSYER